MPQYTIRNVPEALDRTLREKAERSGESLNSLLINTLKRGAGLEGPVTEYRDLDDLAGTWVRDDVFDDALAAQDRIDESLWN